jgi:TRAP-type C4-dicarboxylate transport system permease small subunit
VFLPLAYTQVRREHVVVTLFTDHMRAGIRARLIWFGCLVGFIAFAILLYAMSKGALKAYQTGDAYLGVNQIVTWPARALAVVGIAALIVRLALDLTLSRTRAAELAEDEPVDIENTS